MTLHRALEIADKAENTTEFIGKETLYFALTRLAKEVRDREAGAEWVRERLYELEVKLTKGIEVDDDLR